MGGGGHHSTELDVMPSVLTLPFVMRPYMLVSLHSASDFSFQPINSPNFYT